IPTPFPYTTLFRSPFHRSTAWFCHSDPSPPRRRTHAGFSTCIQERLPSSSTLRFRNAPGCGAQEEPRSREGVRSREPVRLREILAAMSFAPPRYDDFLHVSIGRHI